MKISEREKFVIIVITFVVILCFALFSCKYKSDADSTYTPPVRQTVVVEKISLSNGKYQHFIVSGKNFEFTTRDLSFNVNDTIVIEGDKVFPKNKPFNSIEKN